MRYLPASLLLPLLAIAALQAQRGQPPPPLPPRPQAPQPAPAQFRASVDIVHLDVSVLDADRQPVRGLTPADFTVLENGADQSIAVFTAVDIPDPEPPSTGWMRDVAPDVRSNDGVSERRLFLIVLDDAMIEADPFSRKNAIGAARGVIDRLGPADLAAVVFTLDNRNSQDYTADRARLLAAVDKFNLGFRGMGAMNDLYLSYSVGVLESAVEVLATLPDRRKSIIYIGQGVPVDAAMIAQPQLPGITANGAVSALATAGRMSDLQLQMGRIFRRATEANVNVYTMDTCGLRVPKPPGPPPPTCTPGLEVDYLLTVAENTGGHAVINTNDFDPGTDAIFEENASYYLLGFQSTNLTQDGKFRRLEVRVNRPGLTVRTRNGYHPEKPQDAAKRLAALAKRPLGEALSGVLPKSDLPLQMAAVPFPIAGKKESAVAIVVGLRQPIRESAARTVEKVDLQVNAFNVDGKSFGASRYQADVAIRAGATGLAEYEVLTKIDLKPGRYQLRIAGNVGSLSTSGSLYYDVEVPDVSKAPVTLTGLMLGVSPGPVVAPRDGLRAVLPIVPTTKRAFERSDRVNAFTRVHVNGKGPATMIPLRVQLQNARGEMVLDRLQDLAAEGFARDKSADINIELPIGRLPAGEYLLTVKAGADKDVVGQDIRFSVR